LKLLFCCSMFVPEWALREQFDPRVYPPETYLLCKLQWGNRGKRWIHWVRNYNDGDCHAEEYFLEQVFELRSSNFCCITWYLSWSPCAKCCYRIQEFLEKYPNVNIDIRVARLYKTYRPGTCRGLRHLARLQGRVTIGVMKIKGKVNHLASISPDYHYCWKTFTQNSIDYDFLLVNFQPELTRNRWRLKNILEVSTL
ncbi:ABEC1 enzyme, partial [Dicrurus megarhynchus]|nr:ABEC1 enzyme [Dicrurus megarhynchus]